MTLKYGPYSPSRLATAQCGYNFYHQYIAKERPKQEESLPQARGSAVHEVFEKITPILAKNPQGVQFDPAQIRSWVAEAIGRHPAASEETGLILDMAKRYLANPPFMLDTDPEVEKLLGIKMISKDVFEECSYEDPDAFVRGRADILMIDPNGDTAVIIDHKTQPNIETSNTFQMGFYAWVIKKTYPFLKEVKTVLHFSRYGTYSREFVWTEEMLRAVEDEILTRIEEVENRTSWHATPNKLCQYCQFKASCPALDHVLEKTAEGRLRSKPGSLKIHGDTGQAVRLADSLIVLEELVKIITAEIRLHVESSGSPVASTRDKIYAFRKSESIDWDVVNRSLRDQTYQVFESRGVDPKAYMKFSQEATSEVWRLGEEALLQELKELFPTRTKTTFSGKRE